MELLNQTAPFPAFVGGYGAGKSTTLLAAALRDAIANPTGMVGIFAPTYDLLKLILIANAERLLTEMGIPYALNISDFIIRPKGMGTLIFRSLDNPKRIVGFEVVSSHVDELDTLPEAKARESWEKILGRTRSPNARGRNQVFAYTTPEGLGFVWKTWGKTPDPAYPLVRAKTTDNPFLQPDYVENLRRQYPDELVRAYINGEFCNLTTGTVYYAFSRALNHTHRTLTPHDRTLHVGLDFNIQHMSAAIALDDGARIEVIDEIADAYDTADVIRILKERYGDRRIIIYPDASSGNRTTASSDTDLALLKKEFTVKRGNSNPLIRDRVNVVNGLLCNANGDRQLFINTIKCPQLTEALEGQIYDKRTGQPDKEGGFDHLNDGLGYVCFGLRPPHSRSVQSSGVRIY